MLSTVVRRCNNTNSVGSCSSIATRNILMVERRRIYNNIYNNNNNNNNNYNSMILFKQSINETSSMTKTTNLFKRNTSTHRTTTPIATTIRRGPGINSVDSKISIMNGCRNSNNSCISHHSNYQIKRLLSKGGGQRGDGRASKSSSSISNETTYTNKNYNDKNNNNNIISTKPIPRRRKRRHHQSKTMQEPNINNNNTFDQLLKSTNYLINKSNSISSFWSKEDWNFSNTTLKGWTDTKHSTSSTSSTNTPITAENIYYSFQLLDHMVIEMEKLTLQQQQQQRNKKQNAGASIMTNANIINNKKRNFYDNNNTLTIQQLNRVINYWRIANRIGVVDIRDEYNLSASNALSLIDNYSMRIPSILSQPNIIKTYTMIMEVAIKQNPKESPIFCTNLIKTRMVMQQQQQQQQQTEEKEQHQEQQQQQQQHSNTSFSSFSSSQILPTNSSSSFLRPDAITWTCLMDAYVLSGQYHHIPQATQQILDHMIQLSKNTNGSEFAPNEKSLTRVLQAWVTSTSSTSTTANSSSKRRNRPHTYQRGNEQQRQQQQPQQVKEKQNQKLAIEKINEVLDYIVFSMSEKNRPNNSRFLNRILDMCLEQQQNQETCHINPNLADALMTRVCELAHENKNNKTNYDISWILPNTKSYNSIIQLWVRSLDNNDDDDDNNNSNQYTLVAPERAEYWLRYMIKESDSNPDLVSKPPINLYTTVISAWEKTNGIHHDAPYHGENIWKLFLMKEKNKSSSIITSVQVYNLLLSLWSKNCYLVEAPEKAEKLLRHMVQESKRNNRPELEPNCDSYLDVITSWKNSNVKDAPYKAQAILELLIAEYNERQQNNKSMLLNLNDTPFNVTIQAWAESGLPEAEHKVDDVLDQMKTISKKVQNVAPSVKSALCALPVFLNDNNNNNNNNGNNNAGFLKATKLLLNVLDHDDALKMQPSSLTKKVSYDKNLKEEEIKLCEEILHLLSGSQHPNAPRFAEFILNNYLLRESFVQYPFHATTTIMVSYNHVLDCWKKNSSTCPEASQRMELLLDDMLNQTEKISSYQNSKETRPPNLHVHVLRGWANSGLTNATKQINFLLQQMLKQSTSFSNKQTIDSEWLSIVILGLAKSGQPEAAEAFLRGRIPDLQNQIDWTSLELTTEMYRAIIEARVRSNDQGGLQKALQLLEAMIEQHATTSDTSSNNDKAKPSAKCFAPLMTAFAELGDGRMVEVLWNRLQDLNNASSNQDSDFLPDAEILSVVSRSGGSRATRDAAILHLILDRAKSSKVVTDLPEGVSIHGVLDSLAKSGDPRAGQHAETILLQMQELNEDGLLDDLTFDTFLKVIDCWANSDMEGAAKRAEFILQLTERLNEAGDNNLKPSFEGYMSVIRALSRSFDDDAPERIQKYLQHIQQRYEGGDLDFQLDERAYVGLLTSYAKSRRDGASQMAQVVFDKTPDSFKSTEVYNALILAQEGDSARAEAILQEMQSRYIEGDQKAKPDVSTFNNAMLSWSKSRSPMAAWRIDGLFRQMTERSQIGELDVKPNGATFDIIITTLAQDSQSDSAAAKIDDYLELFKELYQSGEIDSTPSARWYTEAIRAWGSNVEDPQAVLRAKALLDEMHELAEEGIESAKPDRRTYMVYVDSLAESNLPGKAQIAKEVLCSMKQNDVEADDELLSRIQRCWLPTGASSAAWTVLLGDSEEFPQRMLPSKENKMTSLFNGVGGEAMDSETKL